MGRARRGDGPDRRLLCGSCRSRGRLGSRRRGSRRAPSWPRPEARPWGWGIAPKSWKLSRQVTPAALAPPRVSARPGQGQLQRCGGERVPGGGEGDGESEKACGKVSGASSPTLTHPSHPPPLAHPAGIGTDMLGTPGPWSWRLWRVRAFLSPSTPRWTELVPRQSWGFGTPGTRGGKLGFRDHLDPASSPSFSPPP